MDNLPDLSGQPAWVVIVVVGLTAIASLGGTVLQRTEKRRKRKRESSDDRTVEQQHRVPSLPGGQVDALSVSVQALADAGRRADAEAEQARAETRAVRRRLEEVLHERNEAMRARDRALVDLQRCDVEVANLRAKLNGDAS